MICLASQPSYLWVCQFLQVSLLPFLRLGSRGCKSLVVEAVLVFARTPDKLRFPKIEDGNADRNGDGGIKELNFFFDEFLGATILAFFTPLAGDKDNACINLFSWPNLSGASGENPILPRRKQSYRRWLSHSGNP